MTNVWLLAALWLGLALATSLLSIWLRIATALSEIVVGAKQRFPRDFGPRGYNLRVNVGEAAGQSVAHVHMHLIPRYPGDVENPRGGVRGVIPARQNY